MSESPTRRIVASAAGGETASGGGEDQTTLPRHLRGSTIKPRHRSSSSSPPQRSQLLKRLVAVAFACALVGAVVRVRHGSQLARVETEESEEKREKNNTFHHQLTLFLPLSLNDLDLNSLSCFSSPSLPLSFFHSSARLPLVPHQRQAAPAAQNSTSPRSRNRPSPPRRRSPARSLRRRPRPLACPGAQLRPLCAAPPLLLLLCQSSLCLLWDSQSPPEQRNTLTTTSTPGRRNKLF